MDTPNKLLYTLGVLAVGGSALLLRADRGPTPTMAQESAGSPTATVTASVAATLFPASTSAPTATPTPTPVPSDELWAEFQPYATASEIQSVLSAF